MTSETSVVQSIGTLQRSISSFNAALTVAHRELLSLFISPMAYVILFVFLLVNGATYRFYIIALRGEMEPVLASQFGGIPFWFLWLLVPALVTMRTFAEERRTGTFELLVTSGISDFSVVLGKFLAAWIFVSLVWSAVLVLLLVSSIYCSLDWVIVGSLYFGLAVSSLLLTGLVLWKIRRRKLLLFCLLWFGLALGPVSQAIPHHIHRADRFLYLPLVGLVAALAFTLRPLYERLKSRDHFIAMVAAGLASVFLLGVVSARQLQFWRNSITLWEHALTLTPFSALAHQCLADAFSDEGQFQRAIPHYEAALRIAPEDRATLNNYSIRLSLCHKTELRDYQLAIQLAHKGCEIEQWKDPKLRRTLAIAYMNYATDLKAKGEIALAIANYDKAISADPTYEVAMFNQALLLASCSDQSLRRPKEAMRIAEAAVGMLAEPDAVQLSILAKVYAHANRVDKAVTTMRVAIQKAEAQGDGKWIAQLQNELSVLQSLGRGKRADGPRNP